MSYHICHICHTAMEEVQNYPLIIAKNGNEFAPAGITANMCPNCGETIFTSEEMRKIEKQIPKNWN